MHFFSLHPQATKKRRFTGKNLDILPDLCAFITIQSL